MTNGTHTFISFTYTKKTGVYMTMYYSTKILGSHIKHAVHHVLHVHDYGPIGRFWVWQQASHTTLKPFLVPIIHHTIHSVRISLDHPPVTYACSKSLFGRAKGWESEYRVTGQHEGLPRVEKFIGKWRWVSLSLSWSSLSTQSQCLEITMGLTKATSRIKRRV